MKPTSVLGLAFLFLLFGEGAEAGHTFSTGELTPETISAVPSGFGAITAGSYLVPDTRGSIGSPTSVIWVVPPNGDKDGPPTELTSPILGSVRGGTFLPNGFGTLGGLFLVTDTTPAGSFPGPYTGQLYLVNGAGITTPFGPALPGLNPTTPLVTPSGQLFVTTQSSQILQFDPSGKVTTFASATGISTFGMAMAPSGFGSVGSDLLVSDQASGKIVSIDAQGNVHPFATLALGSGQPGLRQMAFAPADFGSFSNDLLVSVSGSQHGGGSLGAIVALDGLGQEVGILQLGTDVNHFDPRGMAFTSDNSLLVSDASDPILIFSASDFASVPEPTSLTLLGIGTLAVLAWARLAPKHGLALKQCGATDG
jgi:hypothetical protein